MLIILKNHDCKYAVEQMLLTLFPNERPVYGSVPVKGNYLISELFFENGKALCKTDLSYNGLTGSAAQLSGVLSHEEIPRFSELQKTVKLSFYKAALYVTGVQPPWGALTGVRPAKLLTRLAKSHGTALKEAAGHLQSDYFVSPGRAEMALFAAEASLDLKQTLHYKDIALYIGIPFCPSRCTYCSFVSQSVEKSAHLVEPYLDALLNEIVHTARLVKSTGLRIVSLYVGGGTPTTLTSAQLAKLLRDTAENFDLSELREFCVEAGRPDTIDALKLQTLKSNGVSRVSINPQSMNDGVLAAIGRQHSAADTINAFMLAREAGFTWVNMDLIAGLPGDTTGGFSQSLESIVALSPENITVHNLSIKRGSVLNGVKAAIPDAVEVGTMINSAENTLFKAGYSPYYLYRQKFTAGGFENTGWSKPSFESIYNISIMEDLCGIVALGAGGVTKLVNLSDGNITRIFNKKYPSEYIKFSEKDVIAAENKIAAFMGKL